MQAYRTADQQRQQDRSTVSILTPTYSLQPTAYSLNSASIPMTTSPSKPIRCAWPIKGNALYLDYHDKEWGVPAWDDQTQFEFLILEGAQAGLSWSTILNKREGYRAAFAGFDPERIARFGKRDIMRLMKDAGIVRNRLKIEAAISNARAYLQFQESKGGFSEYMWSFVGGKPIQNRFRDTKQVPATSPESDALSKDLKKRGFRFVGSTIIYAHMQATGMVNDHLMNCFRYKECKALAKR
jgi:DNA-3-methyladenine glycosylase I